MAIGGNRRTAGEVLTPSKQKAVDAKRTVAGLDKQDQIIALLQSIDQRLAWQNDRLYRQDQGRA